MATPTPPSPAAPRLVVSDLDGTFLLPDGTVSDFSRQVLRRAADAGLRVIFATGRPPRWLRVIEELPMVDPVVVASNGALLWDLATRSAVRRHDVPADIAVAVVADLRRAIPDVTFAVEQGVRFGCEPAYAALVEERDLTGDQFFRGPAEDLCDEPFVKLLVRCPTMNAETLAATAGPVIGDRLTVTHSAFGGIGLLEVSAPGVTKASMIAEYAAGLGIDRAHVAAFGDMPNDLDMLQWVGAPHVMALAHPDLDGVAGVRVGTNTESAVAATIAGWLP